MLSYYRIEANKIVPDAEGHGEILVAIAPQQDELSFLQAACLLDSYDVASALDQDEVPRVELAGGRVLIIWKVPASAIAGETIELGVNVVGLTLYEQRLTFIRSAGDLHFAEREYRSIGDAHDVLLSFLLGTVRHFVGHLKAIRQIANDLEKKITVSMENKHLLQMFSLSESLIYYVDAIEGNSAVLRKLRSVCAQIGMQHRQLEMLDEIILENEQAAGQARIFTSVLSGLMDARGTIVNNNMNVLLKNLTLINIVFLPLNLIASIGGMSEWSMMTESMDWRVSYGLFCLGMVVMGWGTWLLMKRFVDRPARHR